MVNEVTVSIVLRATGEARMCIESIQAQTFSDFEILTAERVDKAILEQTRGKYIYFLDADAMIFDNALEILVGAAERSGADIVHSTAFVERRGENVSIISDKPVLEGFVEARVNIGGIHLEPSLNLYRRDFLARHSLVPSSEALGCAAFYVADKIFFVADYFYVRTLTVEQSDALVERIECDEIRAGYLVTTQRKKLWNVQLHLIEEFARICRKHNLTWFAYAGTLLGAVRHRGFVPWDDDVDLALFRPDYERLKAVIASELRAEYSVDFWYDYAFEGERNPDGLPMLSREIFESNAWWPSMAGYFKIRDNRTSMIEWANRPNVNQGICIDIFPLDPIPPFADARRQRTFKAVTELMLAVSSPNTIENALKRREPLESDKKFLKALIKKPFRERALEYEKFLAEHRYDSEYVGHVNSIFAYRREYAWKREYWRELIELPFERITLPAPIGFEEILTAHYGKWREPVITHSHQATHSADISYREYFERVSPGIRDHIF